MSICCHDILSIHKVTHERAAKKSHVACEQQPHGKKCVKTEQQLYNKINIAHEADWLTIRARCSWRSYTIVKLVFMQYKPKFLSLMYGLHHVRSNRSRYHGNRHSKQCF